VCAKSASNADISGITAKDRSIGPPTQSPSTVYPRHTAKSAQFQSDTTKSRADFTHTSSFFDQHETLFVRAIAISGFAFVLIDLAARIVPKMVQALAH